MTDTHYTFSGAKVQPAARLGHKRGDEHGGHVLRSRGLQRAARMGHELGDDAGGTFNTASVFNSELDWDTSKVAAMAI